VLIIKKTILLLSILISLGACSAYKTSEDALNIWYPEHMYYKSLSNERIESEATNNIVDAQLELAMRLMSGKEMAADPNRAFNLVMDAAENGDPRGQYLLGAAYATGSGTEPNTTQAVTWYKKSALQGYDFGQYWYGYMLSRGYSGSEPNWSEALPWFKKAAEQGHKDAQFTLGDVYESCRGGVNRDFNAAAKWYRRASINNSMGARYNLRRLIELGLVKWKNGDGGKPPETLQGFVKSDFSICDENANDPLQQ
jgi:TPR repeat protein